MIALVLGTTIALCWLSWELWHRRESERDAHRRVLRALCDKGPWTGVWLVRVINQSPDRVREQLLGNDAKRAEPAELTRALLSGGRAFIFGHLRGPIGLERAQASDWVKGVGPRLCELKLRHIPQLAQGRVFALAYASERRPSGRGGLSAVSADLQHCFAASLVACPRDASGARVLASVRYVFCAATASAALFAIGYRLLLGSPGGDGSVRPAASAAFAAASAAVAQRGRASSAHAQQSPSAARDLRGAEAGPRPSGSPGHTSSRPTSPALTPPKTTKDTKRAGASRGDRRTTALETKKGKE